MVWLVSSLKTRIILVGISETSLRLGRLTLTSLANPTLGLMSDNTPLSPPPPLQVSQSLHDTGYSRDHYRNWLSDFSLLVDIVRPCSIASVSDGRFFLYVLDLLGCCQVKGKRYCLYLYYQSIVRWKVRGTACIYITRVLSGERYCLYLYYQNTVRWKVLPLFVLPEYCQVKGKRY